VLLVAIAAFFMQTDVGALRPLYEQALVRRRAEFGTRDVRTAQAARDLGLFLADLKDLPGARVALGEAIRIDEQALGATNRQTLADVAELAAIANGPDAAALWKRVAQTQDAELAIRAHMALGARSAAAGDRAGAAVDYREALARLEASASPDSAGAPAILSALAAVVDAGEAIPLLLRALTAGRAAQGVRHPANAVIENALAEKLLAVGRTDEALRAATDAVAIQQEALGDEHPLVARAMVTLARVLEAQREFTRAERLYLLALEIDTGAYGARHAVTQGDVRALAKFLRARGRVREAMEVEKRLVAVGRKK
jgi:tetratricopeptide (TPR) repeat protein